MSNENNNLQPKVAETTPAPIATLPKPTPLLKVATTGRDMIFALLFLVAGIVWIDFSVYGGFDLGYTIASIILGALVLIYPTAEHRLSLFGTLYATCAVAITVPFCMYTSVSSKVLLFFWSVLLMGLAIVNNTKNASRGWMQLVEAMRLILMTPFERCSNTLASLFQDKGSNSKKKAKGILIGIACGLPALFIIVPILVSSDAAFEAVMNNIFADGISRVIASVIMGTFLAILLFTTVFAASKKIVKIDSVNQAEKTDETNKTKFRGVSSTPVTTFLCTISLVYVVYLFSQLAYFFNAFAGFLPENYTTAQYARRGFFEMTVICGINIGVIVGSLLISKKDKKGNQPLAVRLLCGFICLFSLVIVATVIGKLVMYMGLYGLTELRLYTSLFSVCAAIIIIFVGIRLLIPRFAYFRATAATLAVLSVGIAFADVNTTIARYNTEAYLNGYLEQVDVDYLGTLGSASVPSLVELMDSDDAQVARKAATRLYYLAGEYGRIDSESGAIYLYDFIPAQTDDFREYNIQFVTARDLIAENWDKILDLYTATNSSY
ncbi:MAG: DUF4173 domain-containing protein [Clostridia bacterium]|nr:DUF4173 domain-containing protein [Clostridia bacterium]